jgi:hypothetical protein
MIRQPAGEIVNAFEDLRMVQYHCGVVSAASVGRCAVVVELRRGHQYVYFYSGITDKSAML